MLFRMVPKQSVQRVAILTGFRAVLFRMVPKHWLLMCQLQVRFRAVLFRMVPKPDVPAQYATEEF